MAHVDAGKTTCAERILFLAGKIRKKGEVHHGNTKLDFHPIEQGKGITIQSAAASVGWNDHVIQLVDTPGHADFTIEVERSLRVLDGAVFVLDAASGVECQSETVFRQAARHAVPCIAFVNKCDKPGADFAGCLREIQERLHVLPLAVQVPHRTDEGLAVIDVLERRLVVEDDEGKRRRFAPVPASLQDEVEERRRLVVEAAADVDPVVMSAFCDHVDVSAAVLRAALRRLTLDRKAMVILAGSALHDVGVGPLLDAVVDYLPSPLDRPPVASDDGTTARAPREDEPLAALAFKTTHDKMGGLVTWLRVYAGVLQAGAPVLVTPRGARERVRRVFIPDADTGTEVERAGPGSIVCVRGLAGVRTGETITDPSAPIALESIRVPDHVVSVVVEPKTSADRDRLGTAIARLVACDPSLRAVVDPESDQMVLSGMGVLHLEVAVELLATEHGVVVATGKPHVAYRETVCRSATATHRLKKQSGGVGQFAVVTLAIAPGERGTGVVFVDETTGGVVPKDLVPGVARGVAGAAERGVLTGHPVTDVVVKLVDGEAHAKDSSAFDFEIAASHAFREAARAAGISVLEPVARVEVLAPDPHTGDVIGEIASRRGVVRDVTPRLERGIVSITARVPIAGTFDFVPRLRALTHGRGEAAVRPDGYEVAPDGIVIS
jgi:elongation factor G